MKYKVVWSIWKIFAFEYSGIKPDIVPIEKVLVEAFLRAVLMNKKVAKGMTQEVMDPHMEESISHGNR